MLVEMILSGAVLVNALMLCNLVECMRLQLCVWHNNYTSHMPADGASELLWCMCLFTFVEEYIVHRPLRRSSPLCSALSQQGLNPIWLVYHPTSAQLTASTFNRLVQYAAVLVTRPTVTAVPVTWPTVTQNTVAMSITRTGSFYPGGMLG